MQKPNIDRLIQKDPELKVLDAFIRKSIRKVARLYADEVLAEFQREQLYEELKRFAVVVESQKVVSILNELELSEEDKAAITKAQKAGWTVQYAAF